MHYLHRRDSVYYYRQRLPKEIGLGSITKSLKTKDHPTAKHLLKLISYNVSLLFHKYQGDGVSVELIRSIVSQYIDWVLQEHERNQAQQPYLSLESIEDYLATLENAQSDMREAFISNNQRQAEANLQYFSETSSNPPSELQDIQQGTTEYRELLREILKADVEIGEEVIRRTKGDYSSDFNQLNYEAVRAIGQNVSFLKIEESNHTPTPSSKLASEALKEFIQDRTTGRAIGAKMVGQYRNSISLLIEILGDRPVTDYARSDLLQAREVMLKLPANMRKSKQTRDKTITEIVAMKLPPRERTTVDQTLVSIVSFFGWLEVQSYVPKNIAKDIRLHKAKGAKADTNKPVPFTSEMLQKIFSSPAYTTELRKTLRERPERIFVPLLSLYHGARLNELCQLHNPDIIERDGLVCLSISGDEDTKKRTKTQSSMRVIPMHSKLIEAGLLEYLKERRQEEPKGQLWTNLSYDPKNGYMRQVSYWFNKELGKLGLKEDQRVTFHSFRHTVMDTLYNRKAKMEHIQAIAGHDQGDYAITLSYGGGLSPSTLQETLEMISYDVPAVDRLIRRLKEILSPSTDSPKTL